MSTYTTSLFKEQQYLCCYPGGTTLTVGTNVKNNKKILGGWTIGMVCIILAIVHCANTFNLWSNPMVSQLLHKVYNRASKFDDCPPGSYVFCQSNGNCISHSQRCDRYQDCPDDSDEKECECLDREYACKEGRCISELFLCDGRVDCPHADDEGESICGRCGEDAFKCRGVNSPCIDASKMCDGVTDCAYAEDEANCVMIRKKNELVLRHSSSSEAYVCHSSWKDRYADHFCQKASRGPAIKSFEMSRKSDQFVSLAELSNSSFNLLPSNNCPSNLIVGLLCESKECGRRRIPEKYFSQYMINGMEAARGEFPWQIHLEAGEVTCGGSLISSRWVITAAHCVYNKARKLMYKKSDLVVFLGSTIQNDNNWIYREVTQIIMHKMYTKKHGHDLALLELKEAVVFTQFIQPVCLPHKAFVEQDYHHCVSVGFGKTFRNKVSSVLLKQRMKERSLFDGKNVLAIGTETGAKYPNACMGDSGGPFACRSKHEDKWTLIGVHSYVSFNPEIKTDSTPKSQLCQNTFVNRVFPFLGWIEEKTGEVGL